MLECIDPESKIQNSDKQIPNLGKRNMQRWRYEAREYIKNNEFAKGSMLPKVEACMDFVENSKKGIAIISALKDGIRALNNETGTRIVRK